LKGGINYLAKIKMGVVSSPGEVRVIAFPLGVATVTGASSMNPFLMNPLFSLITFPGLSQGHVQSVDVDTSRVQWT